MVAFDSPEGLVIRECASGEPGSGTALRLADGTLDWDALLRAARRHGVAALVAKRALGLVPEHQKQALSNELRLAAAAAMLQEHAIGNVVRLLRAAGIEPLVFKGQVLSIEAYGEIGLRASTDIDVLVRETEADEAADRLLDAGYALGWDLTRTEWRRIRRTFSEWTLHTDAAVVDLHWRLTAPGGAFDLPTGAIISASREVAIGEHVTVRTLGREHLALYLAVHAAGHEWERFEWLVSFHAMLGAADRRAVRELARRHRAVRRLDLAERLAERALGGGGPRDTEIESACDHVIRGWFGDAGAPLTPAGRLRWRVAVYDSPADVAAAALTAVFSPRLTDWRAVSLPTGLSFLYPLLRPVRLALKAIGIGR